MTPPPPSWPAASPSQFVDQLLAWFVQVGDERYDEDVTQLEHGLQAAWLATRAGDSDAAVAAALLHDIGHLLYAGDEASAGFRATDLEHEVIGARWLERAFGEEVTVPVREHVSAKRYLCSVEPDYHERLSSASQHSYALQGGALPQAERERMEASPGLRAAVALRRRDDAAKVPGREVPGIETYRDLLVGLVRAA